MGGNNMIQQMEHCYFLHTKHTTYGFRVMPSGHLEHLYYGNRLHIPEGATDCVRAIIEKQEFLPGSALAYSKEYDTLGLEDIRLEVSTYGKGDIREPFLELVYHDGSTTSDFLFESALILDEKKPLQSLASSYDDTKSAKQLVVTLREAYHSLKLELVYTVFPNCDTLVRSARLINHGSESVTIQRLMSMQLDFDQAGYQFINFNGNWAREMNMTEQICTSGMHVNSSISGVSSNRSNPFVIVSKVDTTEEAGECYGFNLIYSGNHYEALEVSSFGKTRFVNGINPRTFSWQLEPGRFFETPEAVMTYSSQGLQTMSHRIHDFVREHIVRGEWKYRERPILLNSWEAFYFDFNEKKLMKLAKEAKKIGIELFVLDDGWFGNRNKDNCSLGDWTVNLKKLPDGIAGIARKINELGMDFGIWVEPEMVNEDSDCYRNHKEWVIQIPNQEHSYGRNQMILDLSKEEVQEYIMDQMTQVFSSGNITYVKWDMNRIFSDYYSQGLPPSNQQELSHRYVMGLYRVMKCLTERFPNILFEGCASGGNRFDLGILCYMPQIWGSDNTDAMSRTVIQTGYSYGYPLSTISAHVSNCPNHQTLRVTPLETRFQVAAFGVLGYECNLCEKSNEELSAIKEQITLYKRFRRTLQYGDFYRLNKEKWLSVAKDKKSAVGIMWQVNATANMVYEIFRTRGLEDTKMYHFYNRQLKYSIKEFGELINTISPIHIKQNSLTHNMIAKVMKLDGELEDYKVTGSVLNHCGIKLSQGFGGTGYNNSTRLYQDYGSRMYLIEEFDSSF